MRLKVLAGGALLACALSGSWSIALTAARFTDTEMVAGNVLGTAALTPPTGASGQASCLLAVRTNLVQWNASPNAALYQIERALGAGSFVVAGTSASTSFTDVVLVGGTYKYRIVSVRELWLSNPSSEVTLVQPGVCL